MKFAGRRAPVHKPLIAPGKVTEKGSDVLFSGDGGYIIHKDSQLHKEMRKAHEMLFRKHGYNDTTPLYKENGIYNFYVWRERSVSSLQEQVGKGSSPRQEDGGDAANHLPRQGQPQKPEAKPKAKAKAKAKPKSMSGNNRQVRL